MEKVINLKLLGHPANWFIVWTVLLFGAFAWHLIRSNVMKQLPGTGS